MHAKVKMQANRHAEVNNEGNRHTEIKKTRVTDIQR